MHAPVVDAAAFAPVTLRDGTVVELHAMRSDDAAGLLRFHHGLSRETTYLRFFTVHPELSPQELERFTHVDHHDREAIVATVGHEIVGIARFDRLDDPEEAEVAFVVADRWQGEGLGAALLERLVQRARAEGLIRLVAETLPTNRRMVAVFIHAGLPVTTHHREGVVYVQLDLDERRDRLGTEAPAVTLPGRPASGRPARGTGVARSRGTAAARRSPP
jgi:RimJ/RimL family protein N-acetyltransferase